MKIAPAAAAAAPAPQSNNIPLGIALMLAVTVVFALQDGISRHLAGEYNVYMVVMIRYWFFAAFVLAIAARKPGGIRGVAATSHPGFRSFAGSCWRLRSA